MGKGAMERVAVDGAVDEDEIYRIGEVMVNVKFVEIEGGLCQMRMLLSRMRLLWLWKLQGSGLWGRECGGAVLVEDKIKKIKSSSTYCLCHYGQTPEATRILYFL